MVIFVATYEQIGTAVAITGIAPVLAAGWAFGVRVGLIAGVLSWPLNFLLGTLVGPVDWHVWVQAGSVIGVAGQVAAGGTVGWLQELRAQARREIAERM